MRHVLALALVLLVFTGCSPDTQGQPAPDDSTRTALILSNLKYYFPQLADIDVTMSPLKPSAIDGLDRGSFTMNGQQTQEFLVTHDGSKLFFIAGDPLDVSHTADELTGLQKEREEKEAQAARDTHTGLMASLGDAPVRGNADAPITIIEFSDFQCPYCSRAFTTVETLFQRHPDELKLVFVHYPLDSLHPWARTASIAAQCVLQQDQDTFWKLHDHFFTHQDEFDKDTVNEKVRAFLADTGIDLDQWGTCAEDTTSDTHKLAAAVVQGKVDLGQGLGITGTPAFYINGRTVEGAQPIETFEKVLDEARADLK